MLSKTQFTPELRTKLQKSAWRLVFGGSFNPPHLGHINMINQVDNIFKPESFAIVPCNIQAFKGKISTDKNLRVHMLKICQKYMTKSAVIDTREVNRDGVSYTYDTLLAMRQEIGAHAPLGFIIGADLLPSLHKWHNIEKFSALTNLIIIKRPSAKLLDNEVLQTFNKATSANIEKPNGILLVLELATSVNLSSSFIRYSIARDAAVDLLIPQELKTYIYANKLYTEQILEEV